MTTKYMETYRSEILINIPAYFGGFVLEISTKIESSTYSMGLIVFSSFLKNEWCALVRKLSLEELFATTQK